MKNVAWTILPALIGAALAVWKSVQNSAQRRVRLKVIPKLIQVSGSGYESSSIDLIPGGFPCIEVKNLSVFAVTIEEVGFYSVEGKLRLILSPDTTTPLPKRLESRESVDVWTTSFIGFPQAASRAYATTQCGHTTCGRSPVFRNWKKTHTT